MFTNESLMLALVIFAARVVDVSLGTIRHAMIVRGKRFITFCIAFLESLVWVFAVSKVLSDLSEPMTALAFALGFATGTFVGMTIENLLKIGDQVVKVFSSKGKEVAALLRDAGFRVTEFEGRGRDGQVILLFVQVRRRDAKKVLQTARSFDKNCYLVIEDIRWRQNALL
ncbi:MAG: DUF5698 domain-containing protein [Sphaerochaeta sp.]|jgi:uncharacterized protein YebE (UPF0316 family)|uniref:DUF5698 domain-containing protein n=2 Tax=Sphaerochaeta associata TaxID=1129264 RepID=A0ABY4DDK0_9SPIR|nr:MULTISPECIES: DUF5698 domain-containing protein [Sphaerochaeta]MDD2395935.1 DUF5698 domain-containing protein [Sphaerochaeta sp.]MDD3423745.1 DUF5698 domain-containing protein [Sphaerochaeta sp.]MDD4038556.1 DUF5698 domain-containing protein [Sphaerochaeta sp.]MDX9984606.1 DUF5698 domain-containing protein [Sphaerochaeta sp.]MEA5108642.1 DUF5698 domain-containing protein [Sphaerochaeta associata]